MDIANIDQEIRIILNQFNKLPKFPDGRINYTTSDAALVLTCFVRYQGRILILKRSNKVGTYKGKWNIVAGYIDEPVSLKDKVMEELREELGLAEKEIKNIKFTKTYKVHDSSINKTWIICPVLVDIKTDKIKIDWEHSEFAWINPKEIKNYDIVYMVDETLRKLIEH